MKNYLIIDHKKNYLIIRIPICIPGLFENCLVEKKTIYRPLDITIKELPLVAPAIAVM
jgi:hypothetical protein